jgi:hypothetical protein
LKAVVEVGEALVALEKISFLSIDIPNNAN